MQKVAGLLTLVLLAFAFTACSIPADEPAKKWITFLDKHKALIGEGKFDAKAFDAEGKPLVEELKKHKDATDNKIPMSESVLKEWERANNEFGDAAEKLSKDKGDISAVLSYAALIMDLTGEGDKPAANQ